LPPASPAFTKVDFTDLFKKQYKKLEPTLKAAAQQTIRDLSKVPLPASLRFHSLSGYKNPRLYTIDVMGNKAYKISLEIQGETAILRRVASHKEIDRLP
jgi:mRNA-degrading endonuclease YafQ of YafQ-DinJ toxin-antitoxin module